MFDLSNRISSLRKQNNLSQKQLADKLHVSNQVVSKWEQGKSEPSASMLKDIASVFGMGLAEFLEEESIKSSSDLNSKVANFFSKYYMLVVQIFLVWAANIVNAIFIGFLIGKDIVINILPTYMLWIILLFTLVLSIIQTILYLIKSQGKTITILKFCLLTFYLTLLICGFVFLASTPDKNSHDLFLSIGISYSILFVSLVLDILVGFDIIMNKKPFALGSIAFVFSIVCIGVNLAFSGTIIGLSSALLYDVRTPRTILVENEVTLYELNETYNLNAKLPNSYRKDGFIYQSYDEAIATIDSEGTITAVSYGSTTIEIFNTSKTANKLVSILVKPPHFKYSLLPPNAYTTKPFELHMQVDDYDKYDNISENTEFYVKDNKGEILDAVYDGANVVVTARMFNLPDVKEFWYTLGYRYKGIEVTYSEEYEWSVVSLERYCVGVRGINLPSEYNFSLTVGGSADFVYTWWNSDIIDPGITITILEPTIAEYRDGKIYGISAGQFTVVATSISGVSKTETYIVYA